MIITWIGINGIKQIYGISYCATGTIPASLSGASATRYPSNGIRIARRMEWPWKLRALVLRLTRDPPHYIGYQ